MPKIEMSPEEENLFLLVKKAILQNRDNHQFAANLEICIDKGVFDYADGSKIIHYDKIGKIRRIEQHKVDYAA